jgi:AcrR family transcriptional regulator
MLGNDPYQLVADSSTVVSAKQGESMHRTAAETREHVLRVAYDLFYWQGIRATGIDRVASVAGVAPTTLYRLFASKDDLVAAYVERTDQQFRAQFLATLEAAGPDPRAQILAVFDSLAQQVQPDQCRGCAFLMTLSEFPDPDLPAHRNAVTAKAWIHGRLGELTERLADVADPADLADQLTLLVEGVYASVQALGPEGPARQARALAETILNLATTSTARTTAPVPARRHAGTGRKASP